MPDPAPAQLDATGASRLRRLNVITLFLLFNTFAVNMWLQYRGRGRWANPAFGERVYLILSLVAKSALAWQVFAGALAGG